MRAYYTLCTLVKIFGFYFGKFLQSLRQIPWVLRFISAIFVKFLGQNCIFQPGNLDRNMCKILDFIPEQKFILENSTNSLSKSMKKPTSFQKIFPWKSIKKFREFSGKKNQSGIRKKKTRKLLLLLGYIKCLFLLRISSIITFLELKF